MNVLLLRDEVSFPLDWRTVFSVLLALILFVVLRWLCTLIAGKLNKG